MGTLAHSLLTSDGDHWCVCVCVRERVCSLVYCSSQTRNAWLPVCSTIPLSHTHTHSLSLTHSLTLSLTHTHTPSLSLSLTHSLTHTLSHTHTHTHTHNLTH